MNIRPETPVAAEPVAAPKPMDPRTRTLLQGPIVPTLLRMAWPNVLVMGAQAATGLIETYWVGKLGTDALAGMALVFPGVMLMQMFSAGAMGGGISSAIARALGAGKREQADALVLHALVINLAIGAAFTAAMLMWGRPLYRLLGGEGASLEAALIYSNIVFGGIVLLWIMNALASVIRGTGNMLVPALVICAGAIAARAAVAAADLRPRADPRARHRGRGRCAPALQCGRRARARLVSPLRPQPCALPARAAALADGARDPACRRSRGRQHGADQCHHRVRHCAGRPRGWTCGCRGLRHGVAPRISAGAAGVRYWRAAGGAGRHQYRRGKSRAGAAGRLDRRGDRFRALRGDRHRGGSLPDRMARRCSIPIRA